MTDHKYYRCPICRGRSWLEVIEDRELDAHNCLRCGFFKVAPDFALNFAPQEFGARTIATISGYLLENPGTVLRDEDLNFFISLRRPSVAERTGKMLRFLGRRNPNPGKPILIPQWQIDGQLKRMKEEIFDLKTNFPEDTASEKVCAEQLPYLAAGFAVNQAEVEFLFSSLFTANLLDKIGNKYFRISPEGWKAIEQRPETEGKIGFVAMAFAEEFDSIWKNPIYNGIKAAGFQPFRVDQKDHNGDITDEILANIRTSKFVFADFTDHRAGVYYEAGFAAGLSIPVVRSVRKDQKKGLHFDTRQISHIVWEANKLEEFEAAITNRIIATIGKGPIITADVKPNR